ncbi:MAG: phosphoribosylamine--glycine ligase [Parcubacteria group bacterium]|jgi:phosphoribosylamine--glycine ligase|nr:phosphoribosylamine--glycine ligase [Parcubacteria group bacterium]|tara:strand:- start:1355 stop:2641 length:1287 start_codon:yes stop_codon:yes gene_type:complete
MSKLNVLVIDGGGRGHVLAWKIAQSPMVDKVFAAPGNPGIAKFATCVPINVTDIEALVKFVQENDIGLTVVGPEGPLDAGIVDAFQSAGLTIFGPRQSEVWLEMSKVRCKQLLQQHGIPTAKANICVSIGAVPAAIDLIGLPVVVKPDGGTEGKGVKICQTKEEAMAHARKIMVEHAYQTTGDSGNAVLIEECLVGREASIIVLTDGNLFVELPTSEDHKPREDGDKGDMTGGMGAYSPSPAADELAEVIRRDIIQKLVDACPGFTGVLYIALMITANGPKVLEVNVRFGDPEAQVVLPRVKTDLVPIFLQIAKADLQITEIEVDEQPCVAVVSVSGCYPASGYPKGKVIAGIEKAEARENVLVFQAGTKDGEGDNEGKVVTNGGRVLAVSAMADDIPEAIKLAYEGTSDISFEAQGFRTDIAQRPAA